MKATTTVEWNTGVKMSNQVQPIPIPAKGSDPVNAQVRIADVQKKDDHTLIVVLDVDFDLEAEMVQGAGHPALRVSITDRSTF